MNYLSLIQKFFVKSPKGFTGAILPTQKEIDESVKFSEIVATAAPVKWLPLDINNLPAWPQYDQNQTYECVPTTDSLEDTILYYLRYGNIVKFSPTWKYIHRVNRPGGGMIGTNIQKISQEVGALPYDLMPTPMTEAETNQIKPEKWMYDIAKVLQTDDHDILIPVKDIETLVSIMQVTGKPIMVWFDFNWIDWAKTKPSIGLYDPALRHSVTFIPPKPGTMSYGLYNGEKTIVIQDSTGLNTTMGGKRLITESFFKKYNVFARYKMRFRFDTTTGTEHYDGSVISLQRCLRTLGYFPTNVSLVESFGPLTRASLKKFQEANGLPSTGVLDDVTKATLINKF